MFSLPGAGVDGHPSSRGDVTIGNDVWLGWRCTIVSGLTIGDGAVVGANAVVASDVPPFTIVAGNPAVAVRRRFSDDQVDALLRIRWWDWSDEKVAENAALLCDEDVDSFIAVHR